MIVNDVKGEGVAPLLPNPWEIVSRRRYTIAITFGLAMAAAMFGYMRTPPTYVSETALVLDARRVQAIPTEAVVTPMPQETPALRTELDVISSRMMAMKVLERLQAQGVRLPGPEDGESLQRGILGGAAYLFGFGTADAVAQPAETAPPPMTSDMARDIALLRSNLTVSNDGRSYTIFISYRAPEPVLAATVANTYAQTYLDHQIDVRKQASRRVNDWLGETLVGLHAQLEQSERALDTFRQEAGLMQPDGVSLQAKAVADASGELTSVKAAIAGAQARLEAVRSLSEKGDMPALSEFLGSATIQALRAEEARVAREVDTLQESGAVKSRQVSVLSTQLAALRSQIADEVRQVEQSLENEATIALQKQAKLEDALRRAQEQLAEANRSELTAAQLQREANANRAIYESYLVRYKQTIEQDGFVIPEAQVISRAEPAQARSAPRLSNWLLLGLAGGGGLAAAAAAARELTDRRLQLPAKLEATIGAPIFGALPSLAWNKGGLLSVLDAGSPLATVLAGIRLLLRPGKKSPFIVTSASKGQGKSVFALSLARSSAAAGRRTVLVDANLRDPAIHRLAGLAPTAYLDEILLPGIDSIDLLQRDPKSDLLVLPARSGAIAPEVLLESKAFRSMVAELQSSYDLVVIDTPAVMQALDSAILASLGSRCLFVVGSDQNRLGKVGAAVRRLNAAGCKPEGVILNRFQREAGVSERFNAAAALAKSMKKPPIHLNGAAKPQQTQVTP